MINSEFVLYGTNDRPLGDYFINSDDLDSLKIEAFRRLKDGYTATIRNNITGEETDFSLRTK